MHNKSSPAKAERSLWPWPDSLDALIAAPDFHELLLENERVRVLRVHIAPGQFVPVHTHRWPSVLHVLSSSDFIRRDGEGNLLLDTRTVKSPVPPPSMVWLEPLPPHSVENVGNSPIELITVELKD
jgi:quercetin dioxygenase-like cupin family protein